MKCIILYLLGRRARDPAYLSAIIVEYLRSAASEKLKLLRVETSELHDKEAGYGYVKHDGYVLQLVQDGYYIEALRYIWKNKGISICHSMFLEAAVSFIEHLSAVMSFFSDSNPTSKNATDYSMYRLILNGTRSAAAASLMIILRKTFI